MSTIEPGIRPNISRAEYDAIPAINQSSLKMFRRSAMHARWNMDHPRVPTAEMEMGTMIHAYLLQPEIFQAQYVEMPDFTVGLEQYKSPRATKAYKEAVARFESTLDGRKAVSSEDLLTLGNIGDCMSANDVASRLLTGVGPREVCVVWRDEATGLLCKALMDLVTTIDGSTVVVDLKSSADASPGAFARDCVRFGYHIQVPYYLDGLDALSPHPRRFIHVVVERTAPYGVGVYELDAEAIAQGRHEYREYLQQYASCSQSGRWPGYPDAIRPLSIPHYAISEEVRHGIE